MLIRRVSASDLLTRKRQGRIIFERNYPYFHYCLLLSCRYVMLQKYYFEETKMGEGTSSRWDGGSTPPCPPPPKATALSVDMLHCSYAAFTTSKNGDIEVEELCFLCCCSDQYHIVGGIHFSGFYSFDGEQNN